MAQDIVSGLFGMSPADVKRQQYEDMVKRSYQYGQMEPLQRASMGMYQAGAGLADVGGGLLGIKNPQIEEAKMTEAALTGLDISDPKSIAQRAQQIQDPRLKMKLMMLAQQKMAEKQKMLADQSTVTLNEARAEKELALAEKALRENPNLATAEVGIEGRPGWTQMVLYDKTNPKSNPIPIGAPKQSAAAMRIQVGGKGDTGMTAGELRKQKYDDALAEKEQKKIESAQSGLDALDAVRRNVTDLYDPITKKLKPAAVTLFGRVDQFRGPLTLSEDSANALSSLTGLKDQITMTNLADAKARVGQSFGSMQVQEWDKFVRLLSSLDRSMGEQKAAENLKYILDFIDKKSDVLKTALGGTKPGNQSLGSAPSGVDPKVWAVMTPEERALWK